MDAHLTGVRSDDVDDCIKATGDTVIRVCSRIIKLYPKNASAYYNRGVAYHNKLQYDRAIADYDMAISLNTKYASAATKAKNTYLNLPWTT